MGAKRLDVMAEHAKIHTTISGNSGVLKNSTTDAQGSGHYSQKLGRNRSVPMTASLSGSGPAKPHNVAVQSLVGKLPKGTNQAMPMSRMGKPKVGISERSSDKKSGIPSGSSSMTPPATRSAYRGHTAVKVGGPK